jgi:hypothetical protein
MSMGISINVGVAINVGVSIDSKGRDHWTVGLDSWFSLMSTLGECFWRLISTIRD